MSNELKIKIDWSCKFSNQKYEIYEVCVQIVDHTNIEKLRNIPASTSDDYGLSVLDQDTDYKSTHNHKVLKEDLDNVISYSVRLKQVLK